MSIKLLFKNR